MLQKIFLLALFHVVTSRRKYECGISYNEELDSSMLVNGGKPSVPGEWPWAVSVHANGQKACTGSIISPYFVLTAAHCYNAIIGRSGYSRRKPHFSVHAGSIWANEGEVITVKKITTYDVDNFTMETPSDIAILEVSRHFCKKVLKKS